MPPLGLSTLAALPVRFDPCTPVNVVGEVFTVSELDTAVKLTGTGADVPSALPATAVNEAGPAGKVSAEVDQAPVGLAVTDTGPPVEPDPPVTVMVLPGVAVPEMTGVALADVLATGDNTTSDGAVQGVTVTTTLVLVGL